MRADGWWAALSARRAGLRARLRRNRWPIAATAAVALAAWACASALRYDFIEKRVEVVEPGHLVRGAWQRPGPLRRVIGREKIRTIVTLATVDDHEYRYLDQAGVVAETGVRWIFVPMVNSTATLEQMAEAADLLGDPALQPVFFHCVAGHHRTSLAHAAYRIRHDGWSAERTWAELEQYRWTRTGHNDNDRRLIWAFAAAERARPVRRSRDSFEWSLSALRRGDGNGAGPVQPGASAEPSRASRAASTAGHSSSMTLK